ALLALAVGAFARGVGAAFWVSVTQGGGIARSLAERLPSLHRLIYDKWRVDEFYQETVLGTVDSLAEACVWVDRWVVDGLVARVTAGVVALTGYLLRRFQTGR